MASFDKQIVRDWLAANWDRVGVLPELPSQIVERTADRYRELLEQHFDDLARLIVRENGKLLSEARGSLRRGVDVVEFACGIPSLLMGRTLPDVSRNVDSYSVLEPVGVVAGIPPFNFPAMIPLWMMPLAVACGNTFILKPAEKAPLTGTRLVELFHEAGLPAGVFQPLHLGVGWKSVGELREPFLGLLELAPGLLRLL